MEKNESKLTGIVENVDNILSVFSQDCETCGSHGTATLYIRGCECGKWHDIEIKSW
jgi:small nuclear ribonucleoprotein (snRNP)-like protein